MLRPVSRLSSIRRPQNQVPSLTPPVKQHLTRNTIFRRSVNTVMSSSSYEQPVTAAAIIIGDEILTGKVADSNGPLLAQAMFEQGVDLRRITVIPDHMDTMVQEFQAASRQYTYVFTSGGIGPTHDDLTYPAVAKAFGTELEEHAPTVAKMKEMMGVADLNTARRRMALLPQGCDVWTTEGMWVPIAVMGNIHILPGVPSVFARLLAAHKHRFAVPERRRHRRLLYTTAREGDIAEALSAVQDRYHKDAAESGNVPVAIGSYPRTDHIMLTFEGVSETTVDAAVRMAKDTVPAVQEEEPTTMNEGEKDKVE
eukprot:gb/GECH01006991.1/.p1 GENE.gb/GECH01006991.1/~~gb/GECH01006991.1/.p1  ORF type:complete len:311 (+),score=102.01 gb/GECH01006991.1/:1-933(+)